MNTNIKKGKRKLIIGININKKEPLEKKDVEKAIKIFKEYYINYKNRSVVNG